ncbi:hypothetical protein RHGRI_033615 [Rhododendron griersonianum]|uniref:Protein kinase domain-containing protein n=1 Tax=Rhododendron griersonianum TaxID=479676 RepID=A0AAV6I194_9ERIC|nr:hypothetical protein RHGRI_033615 [Rhododendron griersonianum]
MPPFPLTPPPPPHPAAVLLLTLLLSLSSAVPTASNPCSNLQSTTTSCPPLTTSALSFPFSTTPGCGHPSFQIQCSSPHSTLTINNLSFSLLKHDSNSSLLLSPLPSNTSSPPNNNRNCTSSHFLSIPNQPINLSSSPFRVSDRSCSRLGALRPCVPHNLPNCIHCPYDCKLVKNPLQIVPGCGSQRRLVSSGCQNDVLGYLDKILSMGVLVEWVASRDPYFSSCDACQASNGSCGYNSSDPEKPFLCFQNQLGNQNLIPWVRQDGPNRTEMLCLSFGFFCLLFIVLMFVRWRRSNSSATKEDPAMLYLSRHRSPSTPLPPIFTYKELESSTNGFDPNRKIGDGGFGSVYLGNLPDGRTVAVKHLHKPHPTPAKVFCNEILILSLINHPNMVKIHGYCPDPRALLLVYDYVPNGTLAQHLHCVNNERRRGFLSWKTRVDIALQIASAMEYLHFDLVPPIVHRDITSSNIFVEKDMRVKLGDFGMSRVMGNFNGTAAVLAGGSGSGCCVWTGPQGTPGYLDPDYYKSFLLTEKSDVYSFGVVLLELVTGMRAVDGMREKGEVVLVDFVVEKIQMRLLEHVVDEGLLVEECGGGGGGVMGGVEAVAELAFRCVAADKDDRPDAREVVAELRRIRGGTSLFT